MHELWALAVQDAEQWLAACEPPFWGRPRRRRPHLPAHFRRTDELVPASGGNRPKSVFQIGGAGAVGTGSLRGMRLLHHLKAAGFAIWPFDAVRWPLVIEIYPRVLTGEVNKSKPGARTAYLSQKYPQIDERFQEIAASSEDAFDAAVSALVMSAHLNEIASLAPTSDPQIMLEGLIWYPSERKAERPLPQLVEKVGIHRVGFIGLGIMGRPMASNLLEAGFELTVHNRSPGPVADMVSQGAIAGGSPADVARQSEVVITMLPDTADVAAVLFGPEGVAEGIAAGGVVIDMSTISPAATEQFARRLADRGAEMLDAPVSGGDKGAIAGTLAIMVGGKPEVFARCRPVLKALGENVVHMGPHGSGQRTKLVNQVIGGLTLVALAEGLAFAREMGLDPERVLQIISRGAAGSWILENLGPKAIAGDFAPGFMIRLQRKDLDLAREAMGELAVEFPGTALAADLFARAEASGLGSQGTQGLVNLYGPTHTEQEARMAGITTARFESADEAHTFEKGRFELVRIGDLTVGRASYEPGWKWSEHLKPLVGTPSCEVSHVGLVLSGRAKIVMDDGTETEVGPGDLFSVAPGHDSWVVGDEPYVSIHFLGAERYAKA